MKENLSRAGRLGAPFLEGRTLDPLAFFATSAAILYYPKPALDLSLDPYLDETFALCSPASFIDSEGPRVQMGWHEEGLALEMSIDAQWSKGLGSDRVELFLDTRDRKEVRIMSRYCHHFAFSLADACKESWKGILGVEQTRLTGSELRPLAHQEQLRAISGCAAGRWRFRSWIPAIALYGFDPDLFNFLGMHTRLTLGGKTWRFCTTCAEVNAEEQPAMWTSLRLERDRA